MQLPIHNAEQTLVARQTPAKQNIESIRRDACGRAEGVMGYFEHDMKNGDWVQHKNPALADQKWRVTSIEPNGFVRVIWPYAPEPMFRVFAPQVIEKVAPNIKVGDVVTQIGYPEIRVDVVSVHDNYIHGVLQNVDFGQGRQVVQCCSFNKLEIVTSGAPAVLQDSSALVLCWATELP